MAEKIGIALDASLIEAIDAWIARHDAPRPTREEAIVSLLKGVLGANAPSTVVPNLVTGRDVL